MRPLGSKRGCQYPLPGSAEYLVLFGYCHRGRAAGLGMVYAEPLWSPKRRKLWSVSFRPNDLNGRGSANRKYLLGWRDSTQFLRQDVGLVPRGCCVSLALLLQVWHWVCAIVRFTQTRIEGAEVSHWPECFLSSQGVFTEGWCFSKPLIRSTPRPPYLYFSKCVERTHCFCFLPAFQNILVAVSCMASSVWTTWAELCTAMISKQEKIWL